MPFSPLRHEALWFVYSNILNTQPDSAQWVQTEEPVHFFELRANLYISVLYTDKKTDRAIILKNVQVHIHTQPLIPPSGTLNRPHSDLPACLAASAAAESS